MKFEVQVVRTEGGIIHRRVVLDGVRMSAEGDNLDDTTKLEELRGFPFDDPPPSFRALLCERCFPQRRRRS